MKNTRLYLTIFCSVAIFAISLLLSAFGSSQAAATTDKPTVTVVNTTANPVPVDAQGTINVTGTVSVSNFPSSFAISNFPSLQAVDVTNFPSTQQVSVSNFPDTQSVSVSNFPDSQPVVPAGTPITLRNYSGIYNGDVHRMGLVTDGLPRDGATPLSGQLAIGSITFTAFTVDEHKPQINLYTTDCEGNDLELLNQVTLAAGSNGSTVHIDYPTPQLTPWNGPRNRFCIAAVILNDHADSGATAPFNVTLVGSLR